MGVYDNLGVKTIINAAGPKTRLSGSIMPREVLDAMEEASRSLVNMEYLQASASRIISHYTGAEAGIVTTGAAAGLTLATAACVTGLDISKMDKLPDTSGMKNEVVIVRDQRNAYDHAVRLVGVRLVEAGLNEAHVGVGVRSAEPWEIDSAVSERTAAILYVAKPQSIPSLKEVIDVSKNHDVPLIVDAAGELPPVSNLKKFVRAGASAVVFSGGKAIRGPQASGILCGKKDLIMSAALQMLDMDSRFDTWNPPPDFIEKSRLKGIPRHGIGRGFKAGKEEIVGLLTALHIFVEKNHRDERKRFGKMMASFSSELQDVDGLVAKSITPASEETIPYTELDFDYSFNINDIASFVEMLRETNPAVYLDESRLNKRTLVVNPFDLGDDEPHIIATRIRNIIKRMNPRKKVSA